MMPTSLISTIGVLLEELHARGDAAGLVTIEGRMLNLPKEMVVLSRSKLTLVVTEGAGNNALRATGLLLVHMPNLVRQILPIHHGFSNCGQEIWWRSWSTAVSICWPARETSRLRP